MSKKKLTSVDSAKIIALLKRHNCPVAFHEVRTRFMGNIASPVPNASLIKVVEQLWGGELPEFDSIETANQLLEILVMGLWNQLSQHQSSLNPFKLLRFEVAPTREELRYLALIRGQEIDGFIAGLFNDEEHIDLPVRAHEALDVLAGIYTMFAGALNLLEDTNQLTTPNSP